MIGQPGMHPYSERSPDLYETPAAATEALLRAEAWPPSRIREPCAGGGAISRVLAKAGHTVVSHDIAACPGADPDIEAGRDFFNTVAVPIGVERIVTNAPFKDSKSPSGNILNRRNHL